jgi:hypothetical protein
VFGFFTFTFHPQQTARPSTIKLHEDGKLTSKVIEQYSATGCYNVIKNFVFD